MGLFSAFKKPPKTKPYAYAFICRGPGYSKLSERIRVYGLIGNGIYESLKQLGFSGTSDNVTIFGPEWNTTVYSSPKLQGDGETSDMIRKIKVAVQEKGFSYNDEEVKTIQFRENTMMHTLGYFLTYYFTQR